MIHPRHLSLAACFALACLIGSPIARTEATEPSRAQRPLEQDSQNEIEISLFGQPCFMKGPHPKATLQKIHSISPEKIPREVSAETARELLKALETADGKLPQALDEYRKKMAERLSAQTEKSDKKLPTYPEEEFHRSSRAVGIEYICDFEEKPKD